MSQKKLMVVLVCVALSSQLVGCGTSESQEPTQQCPQHTEEVKESTQIITSQPKGTESNIEDNAISSQIIEEELKDNREPTEEEKIEIFESVYDYCTIFSDLGLSDSEVLEYELAELNARFDLRMDFTKPADIETQYLAWRPQEVKEAEPPQEEVVEQSNIDVGFEADIDPNTGEVNYWNPNTVEEPTNPGVVIDYGGQSGQVKADPDKTQSAQDAGYLPGDPSNYIYGN